MTRRPEFRPIRRVALHLRLSDEKEAAHSLETQRGILEQWAHDEDWQVVHVYMDSDASAFRTVKRRREFLRMIEDAEAGKFDAVLVLKLDRWARGMGVSAIYRQRLEEAGVQLKSYEERSAFDGTLGGFVQGAMADLMAEYYSFDLSIKVARGWKTRADKGLTLGDVPFGYQRDGPEQPICPMPAEAEAVLALFERYQTGLHSMAELGDGLNAGGFRPRSKHKKSLFSKASVEGMLRNPTYAGYVTRHGMIIGPGRHQAIVPPDLFERVQEVITRRARKPRAYRQHAPYPYLLAGIGCCATCGGPLWANSTSNHAYHYYRCAARRRGEICVDQEVGVRAERVEGELSTVFERMRLPDAWQERVRELAMNGIDGARADDERRRWEKQIERARQGYRSGLLEHEDALAMRHEAEAQLLRLQPAAEGKVIESGAILTDMCELWPLLTQEERRDAVRLTIDAVGLNVRTSAVQGLCPKPAFAPLFQAVAESGGVVGFCDWRPRADSTPA